MARTQTPLMRWYLLRRKTGRLANAGLPQLSLSALSVVEGTAAGTTISTVLNQAVGSTITLTNSAGSRFALVGTSLRTGATLTDYETTTTHNISITQSLVPFTDRVDNFTITVSNVFEAASLGALSIGSFSGASTIAISGATAGSVITTVGSLPTGVTLNSAGRTLTYDGSGSVGTTSVTFRETLADSANSPRDTTLSVSISATVTVLVESARVVRTSAAATTPPAFQLYTSSGNLVGDTLRMQTSASPSFGTIIINDTVVLAESGMTAAINAKFTSISSATYVRFRMERGSAIGVWMDPILVGSAAAPTMSSASSFNNVETRVLLESFTSPLPVYCYVEGQDMASIEFVPTAQPATSFAFRWIGDGVKNYDTPDDFDTNYIYDLSVVFVGLNGVEASFPVSINLLDLDTVPDSFSMATTSGAAQSTLTDGPVVAITGLDGSYAAPYYASVGANVRKRVSGVWGSWLPGAGSTAVGTVVNGNDLQVQRTSSASYSTGVTTRLTVGGIFADWNLLTSDDPAAVSMTLGPAGMQWQTLSPFVPTVTFTETFEVGRYALFCISRSFSNDGISSASVADNGAVSFPVEAKGSNNEACQIGEITITSAGSKVITMTSPDNLVAAGVLAIKIGGAAAGNNGGVTKLFSYNNTMTTASSLTVNTNGLGLVGYYIQAAISPPDSSVTMNTGVKVIEYNLTGQVASFVLARHNTSATPSAQYNQSSGNAPSVIAGISFNKA